MPRFLIVSAQFSEAGTGNENILNVTLVIPLVDVSLVNSYVLRSRCIFICIYRSKELTHI